MLLLEPPKTFAWACHQGGPHVRQRGASWAKRRLSRLVISTRFKSEHGEDETISDALGLVERPCSLMGAL